MKILLVERWRESVNQIYCKLQGRLQVSIDLDHKYLQRSIESSILQMESWELMFILPRAPNIEQVTVAWPRPGRASQARPHPPAYNLHWTSFSFHERRQKKWSWQSAKLNLNRAIKKKMNWAIFLYFFWKTNFGDTDFYLIIHRQENKCWMFHIKISFNSETHIEMEVASQNSGWTPVVELGPGPRPCISNRSKVELWFLPWLLSQ